MGSQTSEALTSREMVGGMLQMTTGFGGNEAVIKGYGNKQHSSRAWTIHK